ncbi:MAG: glutamate--cysteine ligase [Alphaproteobacteria bacterium]
MSIPQHAGGPITSRDDLVAYIANGSKPKAQWRIGTEHEKFVFDLKNHKPLSYDGHPGIRQLLEGMQRFGWEPTLENGNIIGLQQGNATLSLEPGGQFELSGAPLKSIHETCAEVNTHRDQVREVCAEIGAGCIGIGFAPTWSFDDTAMMPKGRYEIMRDYMPKVGGLGLEMMFRTCTIQANMDYSDEADMVKKFRVALALQPVATALFANSPFREGKPNGFLSYRSHVWTDVDQARSGMVPFVFEKGFGYERYVDYALKVPMYFVYRDGRYIDVAGKCFEDFLEHSIPEVKNETPTMSDWADHLTTIFPEVRLKTFLETRGADGGSWRRICALPALWAGILYDGPALDAGWDMVKDWTAEEREAMRQAMPKLGFKTPFRKTNLLELARRMMEIATAGLRARAKLDPAGSTEEGFIQPLWEVVERGETRAEELLRKYRSDWKGDLAPLFKEYDFF